MKTNFEKLIKKAGRQEALSAAERDKMRYVLTEYMAFKPVRAPQAGPVPRYQHLLGAIARYLRRPVAASLGIILMVVLASGGIAYAAEGTLPGDVWYPLKVNVLEPLETVLTLAPAAKIQWHIALAERRVNEAAALANEGKLSSTTEATLVANFSVNSSAATQAIEQQGTNDPLDAVVSATDFSAQLGGYETVLTQIDSKHRSDTKVLQGAIRAQIALSDQTTLSDEPSANLASSSSPKSSAYLTGMQKETINALHTSSGLLNSATGVLESSSSARSARGQFNGAAQSAAQGTDLLTDHDNNGAFHAFQNSLSETARLDVLTHTAATLNLNTFASTSAATSTAPSAPQNNHPSAGPSGAIQSALPPIPPAPTPPLPSGL